MAQAREEAQQKADAAMYGWEMAAKMALIRLQKGGQAAQQVQVMQQVPQSYIMMQPGSSLQVIPKPQPQAYVVVQAGGSLQRIPNQVDARQFLRAQQEAHWKAGSPAIITYRPTY